MNRIVIATDGSSGSGHALEEGFELASALGADVSSSTSGTHRTHSSARPTTRTFLPRRESMRLA